MKEFKNVVELPQSKKAAKTVPKKAVTDKHRRRAADLMPKGMKPAEQDHWRELAPQMIALGRLNKEHVSAFREICVAHAQLQWFRAELDKLDNPDDLRGLDHKAHPIYAQMTETWKRWRALARDFGLTPKSASELGNPNAGSGADDWEDF